jgi:hypothetical protein
MGLWLRRMTRRTRSAVPQRGRSRCRLAAALPARLRHGGGPRPKLTDPACCLLVLVPASSRSSRSQSQRRRDLNEMAEACAMLECVIICSKIFR